MKQAIQAASILVVVAMVGMAMPATAPHGDAECHDPAERDVADARGHDLVCVDILDLERYDPAVLRIDPGTTVLWTNTGNLPHTVTFTISGESFNKVLAPGDHVTFTFDSEGSTYYNCRINAFHTATMHGGVIVG